MEFSRDWTRRTFLHTVGAGVLTVKLMLSGATPGAAASGGWPNEPDLAKFTPIDLSIYFAASPSDFGPRERAKALGAASGSGPSHPHALRKTKFSRNSVSAWPRRSAEKIQSSFVA